MKQFLILFLLLTAQTLFSQSRNLQIEGIVTDTAGLPLPAVTVALSLQKDSTLIGFGMTDDQGHFILKRIAADDYYLQISYLGYQNYHQNLSLRPENPKTDLGKIALRAGNLLLNTVNVTSDRMPLQMRKDTIEYNAQAFKTQPGSVVEDLLKKLPGVQVDANGNVRAQGERVQNILVDGKDFFGQDPKIATKNLPADAVDKVQVYDKKSDKAEFTGIEDGREQKTINLKLKEDHKHGYFGNASGGYGTKDRFDGKFNLNRFDKKLRLSGIGMANNTNQQGFSFDDYINFMGGLSNFMSGGGQGGRVRIEFNPEEAGIPIGEGLQNGFTDTRAGGLNTNYDLSSKTEISASYFYSRLQNERLRMVTRQNVLGDQVFNSDEMEDRFSRNSGHRLNLTLKHKIDSVQQITFRGRFNISDALYDSRGSSRAFDPNALLQNDGTRDYHSNGDFMQGNADLTYRLRLGKKGRALVANASYQDGKQTRAGDLRAQNNYAQTPDPELVHQRQQYSDEAPNYGAQLNYTEPLGKKQYLELEASRRKYSNNTRKNFYDIVETPTPGEYYNPELSNHFKRGYLYDRAGLNYLLNRKKYNLTLGAALQRSLLEGESLDQNLAFPRKTFVRVLPAGFFNYDFKQGRNLSVDYVTNLREPSLEQLQPVVDNSDPLNRYIGNPNLKPEFSHELSGHFLNFDQFTMTSLFFNLQATYTQDRITNASTIDSLLRRTLTPVNVKQDVSINGYVGLNTPLRFMKSNLNVNLSSGYNRGILFVNTQENKVDRWNNSLELVLENRKKDKFDLNGGARLNFSNTRYSISTNLNQDYLNSEYFGEIVYNPTKKWNISTGMNYFVYSKESFGERRTVPLWRVQLTRYVLKNNRGRIQLAAFDLLNKNVGISRNSQLNYLEEERIQNLSRYFMLTFGYSISGFAKEQQGGIRINVRH
jgi:hypothetical protein